MLSILLWLMVIAEIHNQSDTHKLPLKQLSVCDTPQKAMFPAKEGVMGLLAQWNN